VDSSTLPGLVRYFTTTEVALRYRTKPATVRGWRHRRYGPRGVVVGGRFLYPESEIERFDAELAEKQSWAVPRGVA
jgi:helix-turn-helix protein